MGYLWHDRLMMIALEYLGCHFFNVYNGSTLLVDVKEILKVIAVICHKENVESVRQ